MQKNDQTIEVELETKSSHFKKHNHDPEVTDIVICVEKDQDLPVRTYSIGDFEYDSPNEHRTISVRLPGDLIEDLVREAGIKENSRSAIIRRFLQKGIRGLGGNKSNHKVIQSLIFTIEEKENNLSNIRKKLVKKHADGKIKLDEETLEMIL